MAKETEIKTKKILQQLDRLEKEFSAQMLSDVSQYAADWILGIAQEHAPQGTNRSDSQAGGSLGASATSEKTKDGVEFGFNMEYASVQDSGFPGETIKPRKAKSLYVPISDKGRRYHTLGKNPDEESLIYGIDYVYKKQVHVPNKAYGSKKGPNKYFSETLKRNSDGVIELIRDELANRLDEIL